MTLASIMKLALRQLDEEIEDVSEYDELFRSYANMGYMIAMRSYFKPRETIALEAGSGGRADISGRNIARVVEIRSGGGAPLWFDADADGGGVTLYTQAKEGETVYALCEMEAEPMENDTDEPKLPRYAHPALADYICYRHLSSGNLAKQSRAEFFYKSFYQQMLALRPQGAGSVTRMRNLYAVTDTRYAEG